MEFRTEALGLCLVKIKITTPNYRLILTDFMLTEVKSQSGTDEFYWEEEKSNSDQRTGLLGVIAW